MMQHPAPLRPRRQDAAVIGPADHDRRAGRGAGGQQRVQRILFQQRVAPGQQDRVQRHFAHHVQAHRDLVDADAEASDRPLVPQPRQRLEAAATGQLLPIFPGCIAMRVAADIVNIQQVHPPQPQTLQAVLMAAQDAVMTVIVAHAERHGRAEAVTLPVVGDAGIRVHQPPDLGRYHHVRAGAHRVAHPSFGQAPPVMRRGIDIGHTGIQRRVDRRPRIGVGDRLIQIAERGRAEPQFGYGQPGASHRPASDIVHSVSPNR